MLLGECFAWGQMNSGEIGGSVQDATGGALPAATIVVQHADTKQQFAVTSNSAGEYLFSQLPVGAYSLVVTATNFKQSALPRL